MHIIKQTIRGEKIYIYIYLLKYHKLILTKFRKQTWHSSSNQNRKLTGIKKKKKKKRRNINKVEASSDFQLVTGKLGEFTLARVEGIRLKIFLKISHFSDMKVNIQVVATSIQLA